MKRLLTFVFALFALTAVKAQSPIYVYGVDYAQCKVFGAEESPKDFKEAFVRINDLLYSESDKYDFSNLLGTANYEIYHEVMIERIQQADFAALKARGQMIPELDVPRILASYQLPQTEGVGFVMIARLLNKAKGEGAYYVVLFDVKTRQAIYQAEVVSAAGGFGLRNYWANTVYQVCKKSKYAISANL